MNAQTQTHNTNPNLTPENQAQTCQADYLEASNFQDEQSLTKENKKQLHKMMKYVRTFPLQDLEIETIRRDLLGMALEAQTRGKPRRTETSAYRRLLLPDCRCNGSDQFASCPDLIPHRWGRSSVLHRNSWNFNL